MGFVIRRRKDFAEGFVSAGLLTSVSIRAEDIETSQENYLFDLEFTEVMWHQQRYLAKV